MPSETFSETTKATIHRTYHNRCSICLNELPASGARCVRILDAAGFGRTQLNMGIELGFIEEGYVRSAPVNGVIQCPTCHLAFFTAKHIVLSPAKEVLQWYKSSLLATLPSDHKPLHEIYRMLTNGLTDGLPDVKAILPFVSLYSIIVLKPFKEDRYRILTGSQPNLSLLRANEFVPAPPGTSPEDPNVARIFDVLALSSSSIPVAYGRIPLSPSNPEFTHRRLWHLPVAFPVTLTTFLCAIDVLTSDIKEVRLALEIRVLIQVSKLGLPITVVRDSGSGSGNTGDSVNDKDEYNGQPTKHLFDQVNDGKLTPEQDPNQIGGGNDERDDFDFSEHSASSNDGGPENWRFGPSFTTNRMVFETCGYILPLSRCNPSL